ncbi:hypothetical protein Lal_00029971 [Lupinus albus]|uniref:Putative transcription factor bHLH family n=1 Tax=Lupinus albus TaxID=3870 RepID=A0A6A5MII1_LUPAL|nr:putative transcription factor bHLH family [Lupinus albus]KAF1874544.1 hypothetical protein Lal_00029971 [Lupinus albus]
MDDYNFFPEECNMDNLFDVDDEEFLLQGNTNSNSSSITENLSPKLSPTSSISSFQSKILSLDNITTQFYGFDYTLNPPIQNETVSVPHLGNAHIPAQTTKGCSKNQNFGTKTILGKRSATHTHDHIMAERKRREKLSQSLIALAALIPGLKKMDKASVLGDAIKHVKELKQRVATLEEEEKKKKKRVIVLKDPNLNGDNDDSSSCDDDESIENASGSEPLLQVEARISGQEVLLRIHCQRQKGLLVKILAQIQSLNLFVVNSSVLPFGNSTLEITFIAQIGEGYNLTIKDLVKNIRTTTLKCTS